MTTDDWKLISLWIHVPIVTAWIGFVMLDVAVFFLPGLEPAQRFRILTWSRTFTIIAIVVIMVTGVYQTIYNPVGPVVRSYGDLKELREKTYGYSLFIKHIFVVATFVLTLTVRFLLAPRYERGGDGIAVTGGGAVMVAPARGGGERLLLGLSTLNLLACLGALVATTRVLFQLH